MRIDPVNLKNKSKLISDYRKNVHQIMSYFDYSPFNDYEKRVNDLKKRTFKREQLAEVLYKMNDKWDAPHATYKNIERLTDDQSVVVIGGQQAGLLTGPLYTINKIISIIQFAKHQERELNIPVIPVFWIAGEDHDFDEINHIYLPKDSEMKKHTISQYVNGKYPISNLEIDQTLAKDWLVDIFEQLKETEYTKDLYSVINCCLEQSHTYVDFFAQLIYKLFADTGLVLIDSASPELRQLESEYFHRMIENQDIISESVYQALQQLTLEGYSILLDISKNDGHLFYHQNGERILLERTQNGDWIGKQEEVLLTTTELFEIADKNPELLSNNVVTRPLMQELLFPTLAFVGGDGEISYWSVLKQAFHVFDIKMPPVLPRLSFKYINSNIKKLLNKYTITADRAINIGVEQYKGNWLATQYNPPIRQMVEQLKSEINSAHKPLREVAEGMRADLGDLAHKNLDFIFKEIDYLENRMNSAVEQKFKKELEHFHTINQTLKPERVLQERVWNPVTLLNENGTEFLVKLLEENCSFEQEHYVVHI